MAWMRLEVSYIDHPKFLALSDRAFRLWHEGKSYCEKHLTDGLIPKAAARGFRHYTEGCRKELQTPIQSDAAALWEDHAVGFKMHDYLDHNDSREEALDRMSRSKAEKERKKQDQQAYRDRKRSERAASRNQNVTGDESNVRSAIVADRTEKRSTEQYQEEKKDHPDRAVAAPRPPHVRTDDEPNYRVILKTAHDAIDIEGENASLDTLKDAVKSLCIVRQLNVGTNSDLVNKAIDSALWQRKHPPEAHA